MASAEAGSEPAAATTSDEGTPPAEGEQGGGDSSVVRSTGSMAVATLISRVTGFLRTVAITSALGGAVSSAFTTASTLPNLITEIVLGAVLTSLVVPVLVRAEKEDPDHGAAFIRRLFTVAATLLLVVATAAVIGAGHLTTLSLGSHGKVNVSMATAFATLLLPQIFFLGVFSLCMALLNTKEVFKPGAWAPVCNNLVQLSVLLLYSTLPGHLDPNQPVSLTDPLILLLGVGSTAGVVTQVAIMIPPLRRLGISLKPLWGIDDRIKQFGGMGLAIVAYVAISQAGYFVTTRIASASDATAPSIYQNAWLLLQVPYGIIGVTLLTAIMPRLSRNAADGDDKAVVHDLTVGTKLTFIALIPVVIFMSAFGPQIGNALFAWGHFGPAEATILGWTVSFSVFTLIPYALVLLHLRVFYAREEAWTPTLIIAAITTTKILLSMLAPMVATSPTRVVILLGTANGLGFVAGAIMGIFLLRRRLGSLQAGTILHTSLWASVAGLGGAVIAWIVNATLGALPFLGALGSFGLLIRMFVSGIVFLIGAGAILLQAPVAEIATVASMLGRVPGLRRFARPKRALAQAEKEAAEREELPSASDMEVQMARQFHAADIFTATPEPAPLSAGFVRGPRLVPGASVGQGRYRLLRSHGTVPSAKFWHAMEQSTGRQVALAIVDTSSDEKSGRLRSSRDAAEEITRIARRTSKLAALNSKGVANNVRVEPYRSGSIVVADWVDGSSLETVAEGRANPKAAAYAFAALAKSAATAHEAGLSLGLEEGLHRVRISTKGVAMLAFPVVTSEADAEGDVTAIIDGLRSLVPLEELPEEVQQAAVSREGLETLSAARLAEVLRTAALGPDADAAPDTQGGALAVTSEAAPDPTAVSGFGSANYTRRSTTQLVAIIVGFALVAALLLFLLASVMGGGQHAPHLTLPVMPTGAIGAYL